MAERDRTTERDRGAEPTHPGHTPDMGMPDEDQSVIDNVREQLRKQEPDDEAATNDQRAQR